MNVKYRWFKEVGRYVFENIDALVTIALGIVGAYISAIEAKKELAIAILGGAISLIAFTILKDRAGRQKLGVELSRLNPLSADEVFRSAVDERQMIVAATQEVVFIQETGSLIAESHRDLIKEFLARGGRVRWIVCQSSPVIAALLAFRNSDLSNPAMDSRMSHAMQMIGVIAGGQIELMDRMIVRHIKYPVEFTGTFKDPGHVNLTERQAALRLQGFRLTFHRKPCLQLNYSQAARSYETFSTQVDAMWNASSKCIFISSKPREGKTTVIEKIVAHGRKRGAALAGIITKEITDSKGDRIGFEATSLSSGATATIANKKNSIYQLDVLSFEKIVMAEFDYVSSSPTGIFILDEVGPIQMQYPQFMNRVGKLLQDTKLTLFGTVADVSISDLRNLEYGFRAEIWRFARDQQDVVIRGLVEELLTYIE